MFKALCWKEFRVAGPLALGVAALATVLHALTFAVADDPEGFYFGYFLLFPNLVALGLPALQVGHEEEVGTLAWQKSLPVASRWIVTSKFAVAFICVLLVWIVCLVCFAIAMGNGQSWRLPTDLTPGVGHSVVELFRLLSFTLMLLSSSFFANWLVRSAGFAVVLSAVSIAVATFASFVFVATFSGAAQASPKMALWIVWTQCFIATALMAASFVFAHLRWRRPSVWGFSLPARSKPHPAYLPVRGVTIAQPGPRRALVWQSLRQNLGLYATVAGLGIIFVLHRWLQNPPDQSFWVVALPSLAAILLGVATFIGDSTRNRCRFLADHGVGRWKIWWTRMLLPSIFLAGVVLAVVLLNHRPEPLFWLTLLGFFAAGSISSMWARRPIVGYAGGPLMVATAAFYVGTLYSVYPEYWTTAFVGLGVVFVCTLRMTRRWAEGDRGVGFHARFCGWIALAALAIVVPIYAGRTITTPPAMPQWREQMYNQLMALDRPDNANPPPIMVNVPSSLDSGQGKLSEDSIRMMREAADRVRQGGTEVLLLAPGHPGRLQSLLFGSRGEKQQPIGEAGFPAYEDILVLMANSIDQYQGQVLDIYFSDQLDQIETELARELDSANSREILGDSQWMEFASHLRTAEQRRSYRRRCLIASWGAMNTRSFDNRGSQWNTPPKPAEPLVRIDRASQLPSTFTIRQYYGGTTMRDVLLFERLRNWRLIDRATKISLDQLMSPPLPEPSSAANLLRREAWAQVTKIPYAESNARYAVSMPTELWHAANERLIKRVRDQIDDQK
jgi:ABC-type transport system involved in multi-copper enzyme maturation permease subunit